jgi:hypothetical protein
VAVVGETGRRRSDANRRVKLYAVCEGGGIAERLRVGELMVEKSTTNEFVTETENW